jgi:hypothetical protein
MAEATCVGCGRKASECEEYDQYNPVEEDGTYAYDMFVCTACYMELIPLGLDVGPPEIIQGRIARLKKEKETKR